ncbi:MAG: type II toxin-antitoxin system HicA family toxin [Candidatus Hydrogenedentota bacterium]
MGDLPVLKPQKVARILERHGFTLVRQRGSHRQYRHANGRATTVPFHKGRDIAPSLLQRIVKDTGLTMEQFLAQR